MKRVPNFDRLARIYRWLEMITFGSSLWRCRCTFLDELRSSCNALVIGDGDGRFTARLLKENPSVRIDALDASREMLLSLVRNAGEHSDRVCIHQADARLWVPPGAPYDLVVTHFFLDCLTTEEVATLAHCLRGCVAPSARWIVSEFAIPKGAFGWIIARPLVTTLYLAFRILTRIQVSHLPDHRDAMVQSGFKVGLKRHTLAGLLICEMWIPEP